MRVEGGEFRNTNSNFYGKNVTVSSFYLGKYEVTQREWTEIMGSNPSTFAGDDLPVHMVNWYDAIEFCNRRSLREGLEPVYVIDRETKDPHNASELDDVRWVVTFNPKANGYRLPTEAEWEYAASGGQASESFIYSGSNDFNEIGWYWQNSGDDFLDGGWNWPLIEANNNRPQVVGQKKPNELGLYDMSGNVREWVWDWGGDIQRGVTDPAGPTGGEYRVWKGGGWFSGDFTGDPAFRGLFEPNGVGADQGFRLARNL